MQPATEQHIPRKKNETNEYIKRHEALGNKSLIQKQLTNNSTYHKVTKE